jgi:hypothetical protein
MDPVDGFVEDLYFFFELWHYICMKIKIFFFAGKKKFPLLTGSLHHASVALIEVSIDR